MRFNYFKQLRAVGTLLLASLASVAWAAPLGGRSVEFLDPVGGDILPGGSFQAETVESSFLFVKLIPFVIRYLIGLGAALAVVALIFAGWQFLTAYGNAEQRQTAQKTALWAIVGLIIAITAFGIVTMVSNLSFTAND